MFKEIVIIFIIRIFFDLHTFWLCAHYVYEMNGFGVIQARSERGSRRLPRERSSEISKNGEENSLTYTSA